jgi:hypothetical protein
MATVNLMDVLAAPQLCGTIQGTKTGIPDVFPAGFYEVDKTVEKDSGTYTRVYGTRTVARTAAYGSPSQRRELKGIEEVPVKLMHSIENITFPMSDFRGLMQPGSLNIDQKGVKEIGRQVREARKNSDNLRVAALTSLMFQGAIYTDQGGNLLPNSTGARTTANFAVPTGNQAQLNVFGTGNVIDVSWANAAADIDAQIMTLRQYALRLTGYPLKYAYYGKNVPGLLTGNTKLANYFWRNGEANPAYLGTGDIPSPLLGLTWKPAYEAFFEDANGVNQPLAGDNQVTFCPEPSTDWIAWLEGKYDVPTKLTVSADAVAALSDVETVAGMFAYATLITDPLSVKMVYGDTFLPTLKVPKAIFQATVQF